MAAVHILPDGDGALLRQAGLSVDQAKAYREAVAGARFDKVKQASVIVDLARLSSIVRRLREAGIPVKPRDEVAEKLDAYEADRWLDVRASQERVAKIEDDLRQRCDGCGGRREEHPAVCPKSGKPFKSRALYAFQRPGIEWLASRSSGLLGDSPGLGKSLQALLAAPAGTGVLVVCPGSLKWGVWPGEAVKWRPNLRIEVLSGRGSFRWPKVGEIVILNYDILPLVHLSSCPRELTPACAGCFPGEKDAHLPSCQSLQPVVCAGCAGEIEVPSGAVTMFADEAHYAKNPESLRGEATRAVAAAVRKAGGSVFALSGTPLLNRPEELWHVLDAFDLAREAFGSFTQFRKDLGGRLESVERFDKKTKRTATRKVWVYPSDGDLGVAPEAADKLQRVMLRRRAEDVLQDLPRETVMTRLVEVDKKALKACDELLEDLGDEGEIEGLLAQTRSEGGASFELWSRACAALALAKYGPALEMVEEYEEMGEPVLVFSCYRAPVDKLGQRPGWATITGDVTGKNRKKIVDAFQDGALKGLACTIDAAGTGLTLHRSRFGIFIDRKPTPALNVQAQKRLTRIGQKRPVLWTVLVAKHPVDERISEIIDRKSRLFESSVDAARDRGKGEEEESSAEVADEG